MYTEPTLKKIEALSKKYKETWGKEVDYTIMPRGITQEKFVKCLELMIEDNLSLVVAYTKLFKDQEYLSEKGEDNQLHTISSKNDKLPPVRFRIGGSIYVFLFVKQGLDFFDSKTLQIAASSIIPLAAARQVVVAACRNENRHSLTGTSEQDAVCIL